MLRTMEEKGIDMLALSEVRWPGHGITELCGSTISYSGLPVHQGFSCRRGAAVVLSMNATSAWKAAGSELAPVSDRLLRIRLRMHSDYILVISVYAPTNEDENVEESESFY